MAAVSGFVTVARCKTRGERAVVESQKRAQALMIALEQSRITNLHNSWRLTVSGISCPFWVTGAPRPSSGGEARGVESLQGPIASSREKSRSRSVGI
jgi:hypothetical protein